MEIIFSPTCLEYKEEGHPESPERVKRSVDLLRKKGFSFVSPSPASEEDLKMVHNEGLIKKVRGEKFFDPDTPNLHNIYSYALLSAGGAILAAESSMTGKNSFSLMRPPGHHAGKENLGGFCYFNNMAIAVAKVLRRDKKVAIFDFDGHYGNGTAEIFLGKEKVIYISLHQKYAYPGSGLCSVGNCYNFPLEPGTGEKKYLKKLEKAVFLINEFEPDLIAISAGFDGYFDDPLLDLRLTKYTYKKIGEMLKDIRKPTFSVLEGGYSKDLPSCIYMYLKGIEK